MEPLVSLAPATVAMRPGRSTRLWRRPRTILAAFKVWQSPGARLACVCARAYSWSVPSPVEPAKGERWPASSLRPEDDLLPLPGSRRLHDYVQA